MTTKQVWIRSSTNATYTNGIYTITCYTLNEYSMREINRLFCKDTGLKLTRCQFTSWPVRDLLRVRDQLWVRPTPEKVIEMLRGVNID